KLAKGIAKRLVDSDLALYVNMEAVNKEFGQQIQLGQTILDGVIQGGQLPGLQGQNAEMVKKVAPAVFQLIKDSKALLLTMEFRPEGFALRGETQVGGDSQTNKIFKDMKPGALKDLDRLSAGPVGYIAVKVDPAVHSLIQGAVLGVSDKDNKEVQAALNQLAEAKLQETLTSYSIPVRGLQ